MSPKGLRFAEVEGTKPALINLPSGGLRLRLGLIKILISSAAFLFSVASCNYTNLSNFPSNIYILIFYRPKPNPNQSINHYSPSRSLSLSPLSHVLSFYFFSRVCFSSYSTTQEILKKKKRKNQILEEWKTN